MESDPKIRKVFDRTRGRNLGWPGSEITSLHIAYGHWCFAYRQSSTQVSYCGSIQQSWPSLQTDLLRLDGVAEPGKWS